MALRISNLRLGIAESEAVLGQAALHALRLSPTALVNHRILRKSLDTRDRHNLSFVYTLELQLVDGHAESLAIARHATNVSVERFRSVEQIPFHVGIEPLSAPPIVIGSGPAGLVAAYFLAREGFCPILLERGKSVRDRIQDVQAFDNGGPHDPESNYLFGEGGAGTFSDGKLTCRSSGPDIGQILELFATHKGKPSIVYDARPHLGSNRLPAVVKSLRLALLAMGGSARFQCRAESLCVRDGRLVGVETSSGFMPAQAVVLATGHSARDVFRMLHHLGVPLEQKPFQLGVRIEHPQETVNRVTYGNARLEDRLGAADYSIVAKGSPSLFSFCMCAGGFIMPSISEPGYFSTNGMSLSRRDSDTANSGLMVTLEPKDFEGSHVLAGMHLQELYEKKAYELGGGDYACPSQLATDYLTDRLSGGAISTSYPRRTLPARIGEVIPPIIARTLIDALPRLDRRWRGRFLAEAVLVGPESRGSSPVRIVRNLEDRQTPGFAGLYPCGEGAGYAGGIVSAAVDGLRTARAIAARFAPIDPSRRG